nr:MAG TPA: hypothetical protein [Caudoviricetes sp.]
MISDIREAMRTTPMILECKESTSLEVVYP